MCRLYGFLATDPTRLDCSLVEAQNALVVQSDRDRLGKRHADGWGIARWHDGSPEVTRNTHPAFADRSYTDLAASVESHAVVAHIRTATVGPVLVENTHPFSHGPWVLAHNGTISGFEHVRTHLDLGFYAPPWGDTDSETVFRWMLNRMADYGLDPDVASDDLDPIVALIEDSVSKLIDISNSRRDTVDTHPELYDQRWAASRRVPIWRNSLLDIPTRSKRLFRVRYVTLPAGRREVQGRRHGL